MIGRLIKVLGVAVLLVTMFSIGAHYGRSQSKTILSVGDCVVRSGTFMPEQVISVSSVRGSVMTSMMGVKTFYKSDMDLVRVDCETGELL